jgi:nucleotide-binding universal stress UspA family protein
MAAGLLIMRADVTDRSRDDEEASMNVRKILVPLDGSALAEAALSKAVEIVKESPRASLVLLRAAEAPVMFGGDPIEAQVGVVREAEEYLDAVVARLEKEGVTSIETSVWYGPAAPAIVEAAAVVHADLIVMSTHGRSGLGRLFLGSIAESVLRGTHAPILLLRPEGAPVAAPAGTARAFEERRADAPEPIHV